MAKYVFLIVFVGFTIGIGVWSSNKTESSEEFLLGGRNMGGWASAFAYATALFSAVIFINAGVLGWEQGISTTWYGVAGVIACYIPWRFYAERIRSVTESMDVSTMPEYFEKRFESKRMKLWASGVIFIMLIPYSASVYQGIGYMFERTFQIPLEFSIFLIAMLTAAYLFMGGYVATAWNSLLQGGIIFIGTCLILFYGFSNSAVGGIAEGFRRLADLQGVGADMVSLWGKTPLFLVSFFIVIGFGPIALPQMVHKFFTIEKRQIKKATVITTIFGILVTLGMNFMGGFVRLYYDFYGLPAPINLGHVMPTVLEIALPETFYAFVVVLLLAAAMSTLSSLALVASSSIAIDMLKTFKPKIKDKIVLKIMKALCLVFIAVSLVLALTPNSIVSLMSYSWGLMAGLFLAPLTVGLYRSDISSKAVENTFFIILFFSVVAVLFLDKRYAPVLGATTILGSFIVLGMMHKLEIFKRRSGKANERIEVKAMVEAEER